MDKFKFEIIVVSFIAFNIGLVFAVMLYVRVIKSEQRKRQQRILDLAKEKHDLSTVIDMKESLLKRYRTLTDKFFQL